MTDTLSPERVAEIRALAEKATPGPWQDKYGEYKPSNECAEIIGNVDCDVYDDGRPRPIYTEVCSIAGNDDHNANAAYIAALDPQTALALLASHEALRAEVERLREENAVARNTNGSQQNELIGLYDQLTTSRDTAAREMREACAAAVEAGGYYVDIDDLGHGPFTIQDKVTAAVVEQAAAKLRALPLPSETKETV